MTAAVSLKDGLSLDSNRCIHVIPRHFSHPNLPSTGLGNKTATTLKSEPKTPTLTEITTSVTNNQHYTPPTSVKECQDDQLDVVTIVPHKK